MAVISFDVIITTYRRPDYAVVAVKSCLNQGQHLGHVIVVDDASGDDTGQRISEIDDARVKYHLRAENGGIFAARHTGLLLSDADWAIHLDDDWELLPNALNVLSELAAQAPANTVMLGARMVWDHGKVSPTIVPDMPIDYREQIKWRNRQDGLWMDNLCAVSRVIKKNVNWPCIRLGALDSLFYLNAARYGMTLYSNQILAVERTSRVFSVSRGTAKERFERRKLDANGGVIVAQELMARHGEALKRFGPKLAAHILATEGMCHLLLHARKNALKCACAALMVDMGNAQAWWIALFSLFGVSAFEWCYKQRR